MVCQNHGRLWSMKYVLIFVCDACCTSKNLLPVGGVWSMCNTMKTGRYGAWLSTVVGQMLTATWAPSMSTTDDAWCTDTFSCLELDIHWVVHRIVRDQLDYREVCVNWVPKNPTDDDKAHCMGLCGPFLYPLNMLHWSKRAVLELKHGQLHKIWNQKKDVW